MSRKYKIRYGFIPAHAISQRVLVINPGYGDPVGPYGSRPVRPCPSYVMQKRVFYRELEESILDSGIRNPLFCQAFMKNTYCRYGTSRLWIAQKHRLESVPVIIADYDGTWEQLEELHTEEDIKAKYDQEVFVKLEDEVMRIDAVPFDGCGWPVLPETTPVPKKAASQKKATAKARVTPIKKAARRRAPAKK